MSDSINIQKLCSEIKNISAGYSSESSQYLTLKISASALIFLAQKNITSEFENYLGNMNSDLSPDQISALKSMGL